MKQFSLLEDTNITHLCFGAHQDDAEMMAFSAIRECYYEKDKQFCAVVVGDGAGKFSDEKTAGEYIRKRNDEQLAAAKTAKYAKVILMEQTSEDIRSLKRELTEECKTILLDLRPEYVYTHAPSDEHPTHRAVFLVVLQALREIKQSYMPKAFFAMELFGTVGNMTNKTVFWMPGDKELSDRILRCFDSQMQKRDYARFIVQKREANAVFTRTNELRAREAEFGLDMTELIDTDESLPEFLRRKSVLMTDPFPI